MFEFQTIQPPAPPASRPFSGVLLQARMPAASEKGVLVCLGGWVAGEAIAHKSLKKGQRGGERDKSGS